MLNIKVLGIGGTRYFDLVRNLNKAIEQLGFDVQVEFIKEVEEFIKYEILEIPALVVNEVVVSKGKLLEEAEIINELLNIKKTVEASTEKA